MASRGTLRRDDSHIYYNATLHNHITNTSAISAHYIDQRSDVLIENPSEWHMSIIRDTLPANIPIFVFQDNAYHVTLSYGGNDYVQAVQYVASDSDSTVRNIYNYQWFLDAINNAYSSAYQALITDFPGAPPTTAPKMYFHPQTSFFYFLCDEKYDPNIGGATIQIYMDTALFYKFEAFKVFFNGFNLPAGTGQYKNYQIIIQDLVYNRSGGFITMYQEVPSLGSMDDYQAIVITSNSLPTRTEYLPLSTDANNTRSSGATFKKIITDFAIPTGGNSSSGASSLSSVAFQYLPTAEYRLLDLVGNNPITTIDFSVYLQDREGNLVDFFIQPGHTLTVKLLFRKKEKYIKG